MEDNIRLATRVCQLESNSLDEGFNEILEDCVDRLEYPKLSDELKLLSKLYVSVNLWKYHTTPGRQVYNITLQDSKWISGDILKNHHPHRLKLVLMSVMNLIVPYLIQKLIINTKARRLISSVRYQWMTLENTTTAFKAITLLNFLIFLSEGKYLTIQDRLLGILPGVKDKYYGANIAINRVQMQIIHRETLWKYLAEFLITITPYVNITWIKNKTVLLSSMFNIDDKKDTANIALAERYNKKNYLSCGECSKQPYNPHSIGCRHVFCYYCIESKHLSDTSQGYNCQECNYKTVNKSDVVPIKVY